VRLFFQVETDGRTATQSITSRIFDDGEGGRVGLPDVLFVIVVLGGDHDAIGDQEGRVEADAELADKVADRLGAAALRHFVKELGSARFGDGAQLVDEVGARHANTRVRDVQDLVFRIRFDFNGHFLVGLHNVLVGQGEETDFVQSVGCV